jgi:ABC-type thiamin/hydroxymethylpyrimidine transport system permease subunit
VSRYASVVDAGQSERFDVNTLLVGLIAGVFGMAYFVYGKRQTKLTPMIAGVMLCIYPYFIDSLLWLCVVGALLLVAPFVIDF